MTSQQRREALSVIRDAEDEQVRETYRGTDIPADSSSAGATATIAVAHAILALDTTMQGLANQFHELSRTMDRSLTRLSETFQAVAQDPDFQAHVAALRSTAAASARHLGALADGERKESR